MTLVTIRPGVTLEKSAAASFRRVEGVAGRIDVNSSYRDWDLQYQLWLAWKNGSGVLALHPDRSMHCKGLAIDTDDVTVMRSMGDYGWRGTVPTEDWHFDYFAHLDNHRNDPVPAGGDAVPFPIEEDHMNDCVIVQHQQDGDPRNGVWLAAPGHFHHFTAEQWGYFDAKRLGDGSLMFDDSRRVSTDSNPRAFDIFFETFAPAGQAHPAS